MYLFIPEKVSETKNYSRFSQQAVLLKRERRAGRKMWYWQEVADKQDLGDYMVCNSSGVDVIDAW